MGLRRQILDVREPIFGLERGDFKSEWGDLSLLGLILGLKEPNLGLRSLGGTDKQTDGKTDRHTDGRTDIRKFTPVSYRTSALRGRCPKRL